MTKKYKPGTKIIPLDVEDAREDLLKMAKDKGYITIRKSRRYEEGYDFEEAPIDHGWSISNIENPEFFRLASWKNRYQE